MVTITDMGMVEVNCRVCERAFIASGIEAAMAALRAHEEEVGHGQLRKVSAEIYWTYSDLRFLKGVKISPE